MSTKDFFQDVDELVEEENLKIFFLCSNDTVKDGIETGIECNIIKVN